MRFVSSRWRFWLTGPGCGEHCSSCTGCVRPAGSSLDPPPRRTAGGHIPAEQRSQSVRLNTNTLVRQMQAPLSQSISCLLQEEKMYSNVIAQFSTSGFGSCVTEKKAGFSFSLLLGLLMNCEEILCNNRGHIEDFHKCCIFKALFSWEIYAKIFFRNQANRSRSSQFNMF